MKNNLVLKKKSKCDSLLLVQFIFDALYIGSSRPQETEKRTCLACAVLKVFGDKPFLWLLLLFI